MSVETAGLHIQMDVWFERGVMDGHTGQRWLGLLRRMSEGLGLAVLAEVLHVFGPESALTAVLVLSTSHASVHTWPEFGYAAIDLFTCGTPIIEEAVILQAVRSMGPVRDCHLHITSRGGEYGIVQLRRALGE